MSHPLDRPVWNALAGPLGRLSVGDGHALRFRSDVNILAAAADKSAAAAAALAALAGPDDPLGTVEAEAMTPPPGLTLVTERRLAQMILEDGGTDWGSADWQPLGEADAADMAELAELTRPGPWRRRSHLMGGFVGVREGGAPCRLVAMAGERMRVAGWTEVSGVCTHPDARGRGLATALMGVVAGRARERGERSFLHAYADNAAAVGLYERLGFRTRREVLYSTWTRRA